MNSIHAALQLSPEIIEVLIRNSERKKIDPEFDPLPAAKLFTPDAGATWLLTELDPEDQDTAYGLSDLGQGMPEQGYVSLTELASIRGGLGLPIERDLYFTPTKTISKYAQQADFDARIIT